MQERKIIKQIKSFIRKEPILTAATLFAFLTMFIVPVDSSYIEYIDSKTLLCLFSLMVALKGIECEGLISVISIKVSSKLKNLRVLAFFLVFACFFSSMLMTNDIALIAVVPITTAVLSVCEKREYSAFIIILQTLAANIGSSLTPIGNPQNLFIFMQYEFEPLQFILIMLPFVLFGGMILAFACLILPCLPIKNKPVSIQNIRGKVTATYGIMFCLAVAAVFGVLSYWVSAAIIIITTFFTDKRILAKVDYSLLLTFIAIFILVGNIARIDIVNEFISVWARTNTLLTAIVTSQFFSNVPAAVMLSGFTNNATELLLGVNVGGMGTLIASMASVISFKLYTASFPEKVRQYLIMFTVINIIFLILSLFYIKLFEIV